MGSVKAFMFGIGENKILNRNESVVLLADVEFIYFKFFD